MQAEEALVARMKAVRKANKSGKESSARKSPDRQDPALETQYPETARAIAGNCRTPPSEIIEEPKNGQDSTPGRQSHNSNESDPTSVETPANQSDIGGQESTLSRPGKASFGSGSGTGSQGSSEVPYTGFAENAPRPSTDSSASFTGEKSFADSLPDWALDTFGDTNGAILEPSPDQLELEHIAREADKEAEIAGTATWHPFQCVVCQPGPFQDQ